MEIIFCADPLNPKSVDSDYVREVQAVSACSLPYSIVDYEALVNDNDISRALKQIPKTQKCRPAIYRGWMMTPDKYAILYHALENEGVKLINTPAQYQHSHYLPENYPVIQNVTPKTVWIKKGDDFSSKAIMKILDPFGTRPVILKDYVKSQKHYWHEACFIPSAAFESIGTHPKSGMPLSLEYRIFFLKKKPVMVYPYWDEGKYPYLAPPIEVFREIAQRVDSQFFTMDVAKSEEFGWLIVELGDAQVAGLPDNANVKAFYERLYSDSTTDDLAPLVTAFDGIN